MSYTDLKIILQAKFLQYKYIEHAGQRAFVVSTFKIYFNAIFSLTYQYIAMAQQKHSLQIKIF